jgi:hypothetical protein
MLLLLVSTAYGQYAPTSAKTKFVNGIAIGSKDTSAFSAADTMVLTIARDSVMYYKYRGVWRPIATGGNLSAYKLISDTLFNNGYTTRARTKQYGDSIAALKLNIGDTAAMLSNYRRTTTKIVNSDLENSTISGVALGSTLSGLINSYGINGSIYNGSAAQIWFIDTSLISTKANVTGAMVAKLNISDTAAMLLGLSLDRVLANGNTSGRDISVAKGTFASSGDGTPTVDITHSSGSGIALNITKGGNGEGLYVNKTSGSGNAATIIGTLNATTLVKSGGTSSQFLMADGSVNTSVLPSGAYLPLSGGTLTGALSGTTASFSGGVNMATSSGNVGIGTVTPQARLSLGNLVSAQKLLLYDNFDNFKYGLGIQADEFRSFYPSNAFYTIGTVSTSDGSTFTESMRINSSGNLGLGVTPSADIWSSFKGIQINTWGGGIFSGSAVTNFVHNNYYDGTNLKYFRNGSAALYQQNGNIHTWYNAPSGTAGNAISFTQAMTLTSAGRLLLNTTTDNGTDALQVAGSGLFTNGVNMATSSGNVGIGTDSPEQKFHVEGRGIFDGGISSDIITLRNDSGGFTFGNTTNLASLDLASTSNFRIRQGSSIPFYLASTGAATFSSTVTASGFIVSSDRRLKNIVSRSGDMVTYTLKADKNKILHYGYIAQEVEKVLPTTVSTDDKGMKAVNYIEVLVKKVNDLEKKIEQLEKLLNK